MKIATEILIKVLVIVLLITIIDYIEQLSETDRKISENIDVIKMYVEAKHKGDK